MFYIPFGIEKGRLLRINMTMNLSLVIVQYDPVYLFCPFHSNQHFAANVSNPEQISEHEMSALSEGPAPKIPNTVSLTSSSSSSRTTDWLSYILSVSIMSRCHATLLVCLLEGSLLLLWESVTELCPGPRLPMFKRIGGADSVVRGQFASGRNLICGSQGLACQAAG